MGIKQDIERDIELAHMMAADIDKVYKRYAKAALRAETDRLSRVVETKYMGCLSADELRDGLFAYGSITEDEYCAGIDFFEALGSREKQLSLIELHRKNLKEIRDRWKGTVKELQAELDELNGVVKDNRTFVEKLEAEERAQRYAQIT